jgi:hypothetical protein
MLLSLVMVMAVAVSAFAQEMHLPAGSMWKLNVAKSDFGGMPGWKSDMFIVTKDTAMMLIWHGTTVEANGKVDHPRWSGKEDGTMKPVMGMPGETAGFKTDGTSQWKGADGSTWSMTMSVSPDMKTATFNVNGMGKDGKAFMQKLVYERSMMHSSSIKPDSAMSTDHAAPQNSKP